MSALGAIVNLDRKPVDEDALQELSKNLISRGPDSERIVIDKHVGMCYRALHTTKESRREQQPVVTASGSLLVFDGVIFNRDELLSELYQYLINDDTDVAIVSAGLRKYGVSFLEKVVGNFALVKYDAATNELLLARDPFGLRPLFYSLKQDQIVVSSILEAIPDWNLGELDHQYIASYIVSFPEPSRTPYKNIEAIEPGYAVIIPPSMRPEKIRIWYPEQVQEQRYASDAQYEEQVRELLEAGVRSALRTDGRPVWSSLSGGLDSSTIVCLADQLIDRHDCEARELNTFSIVFDTAVTSDERKYIRAVEEQRSRSGCHLVDDELWMDFDEPSESLSPIPSPLLCVPKRSEQMVRAMDGDNARVLLNGLGGDHVFWNMPDPSPQLARLLQERKLPELHRQLKRWSPVFKQTYLPMFLKMSVLPFLPKNIRSRYQKIKTPDWIDPLFSQRFSLCERMLPPDDPYGFEKVDQQIQSSALQQLIWLLASGSYQESPRIEVRSPLLYRPLVEFLLSVPFDQKVRPSETRSLMRRTLRDVLPQKVLMRPGKGEISEAIKRGWYRQRERLQSLFADSRICALGYVQHSILMNSVKLAIHGAKVDIGALSKAVSLEIWLRSIEQRGVRLAHWNGPLRHTLGPKTSPQGLPKQHPQITPTIVRHFEEKGGRTNELRIT